MKKYLAMIYSDKCAISPWVITFSAKNSNDAILVVEEELLSWSGEHIIYEIYELFPRSFKRNKPEPQFFSVHAGKGSYHTVER